MRSLFVRMAALCLLLACLASGRAFALSGMGPQDDTVQAVNTLQARAAEDDDFEALRIALLAAEPANLCLQVQQIGWQGLTLESTLRVASSREETLVGADAAGLLRGYVALIIHDQSCAEPPADVLIEAEEYSRRFGWPSSDRLLAP